MQLFTPPPPLIRTLLLNIQNNTDKEIAEHRDASAFLTRVNNQMGEIAVAESKKLLGKLVKLAFSKERLQF